MPLKSCDTNAVKSKDFPLLWAVLSLIIILPCFEHWLSLLCLCQERMHLREMRWAYLHYIHCVLLLPVLAKVSVVVHSNPGVWFSLRSFFWPKSGHQQWTLRTGREQFLQKCYIPQNCSNSYRLLFPGNSFVTKAFVQLSKSSKGKAPTKSCAPLAQWRVVCTIIWS